MPPFGSTSSSKSLGDYTHSHQVVDKSTYSCFPIGECEACSPLEKKTQPYCIEFGNKQAIRCEWDDAELQNKNQTTFDDDDAISLPSFRPCRQVKSIERMRFIKFEAFNLVMAILSLVIFSWRQKKIAREQYQKLAQRIGITVV
ncbi:uncharacterized protein BX663DRAFT_495888 [Cokeromyces recurvatus]|uniref:uncharacterized protein n=1 Tax=Cokeromyces recurvatus TaxID=90255 RepID=UPI002220B811|nr:uncharacterized protein BX663DRAFT_495888 [Cokeromyces recurvatus]KAI7906283.1 hypothetical protein BX663DRAFT_495888 [Cokeromyces recurvatus]